MRKLLLVVILASLFLANPLIGLEPADGNGSGGSGQTTFCHVKRDRCKADAMSRYDGFTLWLALCGCDTSYVACCMLGG